MFTILYSAILWAATPTPRGMICNGHDHLVKIVQREKATFRAPAHGRELLRILLEELVVNPQTDTIYGPQMREVPVRDLLADLDRANELAVRPGPDHCVELFVGEDARLAK